MGAKGAWIGESHTCRVWWEPSVFSRGELDFSRAACRSRLRMSLRVCLRTLESGKPEGRTADPSAALPRISRGTRWRWYIPCAFPLQKGAHVALSNAAWQEIRERSGRDDKGRVRSLVKFCDVDGKVLLVHPIRPMQMEEIPSPLSSRPKRSEVEGCRGFSRPGAKAHDKHRALSSNAKALLPSAKAEGSNQDSWIPRIRSARHPNEFE
jgi:hypothetical protein